MGVNDNTRGQREDSLLLFLAFVVIRRKRDGCLAWIDGKHCWVPRHGGLGIVAFQMLAFSKLTFCCVSALLQVTMLQVDLEECQTREDEIRADRDSLRRQIDDLRKRASFSEDNAVSHTALSRAQAKVFCPASCVCLFVCLWCLYTNYVHRISKHPSLSVLPDISPERERAGAKITRQELEKWSDMF